MINVVDARVARRIGVRLRAAGRKSSYMSHMFFNLRIVLFVYLNAAFVTTGPSFLNLLSKTKTNCSSLIPKKLAVI